MRSLFFYCVYLSLLSQLVLVAGTEAQWDSSGFTGSPTEEGGNECIRCHQKIFEEVAGFPFQHSDFVINGCPKCHISDGASGSNWNRVSSDHFASEHLVILSDLSMESTYKVKIGLIDKEDNKNESDEILFVPDSVSEYWVDDEAPPSFIEVDVNRIDVAILTNARIGWKTDEFSDSKVEYGTTSKYGNSAFSDLYRKKHNIKIDGLENNKVYHYRVISKDLFGNESISNDYTFDTSKSFNNEPEAEIPVVEGIQMDSNKTKEVGPEFKEIKILRLKLKEKEEEQPIEKKEEQPDYKILAVKDKVAVLFIASNQVKSFVEYKEGETASGEEGDTVSETEKHGTSGLMRKERAGIGVCKECHQGGASHPVGMRVDRKMPVPEGLPVADGGIMTCVTCHSPHGSSLRYLAREDFESVICLKCHMPGM